MINQYIENPSEALKLQRAVGIRIPPHLHTSAELIYVEEGSAILTLGSLEYQLQSGDFVYIMPSNLHSIAPDTARTSIFVINCKCDLIENVIKKYNGSRPASPVLRAHDIPRELPYALSSLAHEENDDVAAAWLNLVFTMVCSRLRFTSITEGATSELSSRILAYLGEHYREAVTLESLANAMGVSRFHLSHMFASKFGIGFKEYVNNLRVECAKGLLRSTDIPISEVSTNSGFENQRTFNRVFSGSTGISPRDYRYGKSEALNKEKNRIRPTVTDQKFSSEEVAEPTLSSKVNVVSNEEVILTPEIAEEIRSASKSNKKGTSSKSADATHKNNKKTTAPKAKDLPIENEKRTPNSPFDKKTTDNSKRSKTAIWLL